MNVDKLPLETQTLYAEMMEQLVALEAHRSMGHASGCFTAKDIKGASYYIFNILIQVAFSVRHISGERATNLIAWLNGIMLNGKHSGWMKIISGDSAPSFGQGVHSLPAPPPHG